MGEVREAEPRSPRCKVATIRMDQHAPARIRTWDPRIRSPPLCPLSYRRAEINVPPRLHWSCAVAVAQLVEPRVVVPVVVGSSPIRHP